SRMKFKGHFLSSSLSVHFKAFPIEQVEALREACRRVCSENTSLTRSIREKGVDGQRREHFENRTTDTTCFTWYGNPTTDASYYLCMSA
ncbi:hypothetical protein RRG08_042883, partial [Elysia crispata]